MTNKSIYPHVPYFYIIKHIASGKLYAGSRWAFGCNPQELMKPDGYSTSSKHIKSLVEAEGSDSFKILAILTEVECNMSVHSYETKFLQVNDCAGSEKWLNKHNNSGDFAWGTEQFYASMMEKYGVKHSMQLPEFQDKMYETNLERHGYKCALSDQPKKLEAMVEKYGETHPMHIQEFKDKRLNTHLDRYGVAYPQQNADIRKATLVTLEKRYGPGVTNPMNAPELKSKHTKAIQDKYGSHIVNVSQIPGIKVKISAGVSSGRTKLKNRKIVSIVRCFIGKRTSREAGIRPSWVHSKTEYLKEFCDRNSIRYSESDFDLPS